MTGENSVWVIYESFFLYLKVTLLRGQSLQCAYYLLEKPLNNRHPQMVIIYAHVSNKMSVLIYKVCIKIIVFA